MAGITLVDSVIVIGMRTSVVGRRRRLFVEMWVRSSPGVCRYSGRAGGPRRCGLRPFPTLPNDCRPAQTQKGRPLDM